MLCREKGFDWRHFLSNINLIAVLIGAFLFITRIPIPVIAADTMNKIGAMIGPLSMIVTGMLIGGVRIREIFVGQRIYLVTFFRLILFPAFILVFLKWTGLRNLAPEGTTILFITLLAAMTPSASTITQMAQIYGANARYSSAINMVTTLLCILTMPVFAVLYFA